MTGKVKQCCIRDDVTRTVFPALPRHADEHGVPVKGAETMAIGTNPSAHIEPAGLLRRQSEDGDGEQSRVHGGEIEDGEKWGDS